jgi:hypothetical protein
MAEGVGSLVCNIMRTSKLIITFLININHRMAVVMMGCVDLDTKSTILIFQQFDKPQNPFQFFVHCFTEMWRHLSLKHAVSKLWVINLLGTSKIFQWIL